MKASPSYFVFWVLFVVACAKPIGVVPRGTAVPVTELESRRTELGHVVQDELAASRVARAFYVTEVEKTRQLSALQDKGVASAGALSPANLTLRPSSGHGSSTRGLTLADDVPAEIEKVRVEDDQRYWRGQHEVEDMWRTVSTRNIPYGLAFQGRPLVSTVEEVQRTLPPKHVLLSYFIADDAAFVFAIRQADVRAERLPASPAQLLGMVQSLVRATRNPSGDWSAAAAEAYAALLAPIEASLAGAEALTIVPHRFLSNVPFAVLRSGPGAAVLIDRVTIGYAPSASFYAGLLQRPLFTAPPRMLAVGNPTAPPPWPALPDAEREARSLARVFEGSMALSREAATETRFYDLYRTFNVLHFATHGMLAGTLSSSVSSLVLAPSARADGYLTANEISRLDLSRCYLAVLSACETNVATGSGASLDSISAAFLAAGAGSVVGSQWKVSDESTADLMVAFYSDFLDQGVARALRSAQLRLAKNPATAHPFYWAAFVVYGWDR